MTKDNVKKFFSSYFSWLLVIAEFLLFALLSDTFGSWRNIMTISRQVCVTCVLAFGVCYVMLSGGMDLSVGSTVSMVGVIVAKCYAELGLPIPVSILGGLLTGALIGFLNGFLITRTKMPPIIGTIGMQQVIAGLALLITNGNPVYKIGNDWKWIAQGNIAGTIPVPLIFVAIVGAITIFVLTKTYFGRHIYACGSNSEAARLSGIKVDRVHVIAYVISGLLAAVAGIILMSRVNSGQPTGGQGLETDVLTALVIGGISFSGGQGKIINVLSGSLVIGILSNGLVNIGMTEFWQKFIKGCVLLLAVGLDAIQHNRKYRGKK